MKNYKVNSTILKEINSNANLSSYLRSLDRGRPATPRSWLYECEDAKTVLQNWIPLMKAANNKSPFGREFIQFDLKQVEKFGPQGKVPPISSEECQSVIEPLYVSSTYDNEDALERYFCETRRFAEVLFGKRLKRSRPRSFDHVVDDMRARDTLVTNSGFPRFARRSKVQSLEVQDAKLGKAYDYPAIILFRQYNGKLRPVWMFPMSLNLIEFSFSQVIQDALQKSTTLNVQQYLSPWKGYEDVKLTLTKQWKSQQLDGGDTTAMDAHMRPAQIRLVYEIVKWLFQENYWDALYKSLMHVNEINLLSGEDVWYEGIHGLASGSGWTQLTETVLQMFMCWIADIGFIGQGIGDDFYWSSNMSADELVDYLGNFGLPANPSKQTVSDSELHFLQRMNRKEFFSRDDRHVLGAYYPTIRALNSMLNPEKYHSPKLWSSDMFCIRNYMILENCVDDPCFDEFVKFVVKGQKDMIPFAKKSSSDLDRIQRASRLLPGLNPSYNQEKREKPLSSFSSIKIAKTL